MLEIAHTFYKALIELGSKRIDSLRERKRICTVPLAQAGVGARGQAGTARSPAPRESVGEEPAELKAIIEKGLAAIQTSSFIALLFRRLNNSMNLSFWEA